MATVGRTMGGSNARRVRRQGPVTLRDKQIPATTTDQRLLDRRGPSDWVHADPWRVMRIQAEFVEGFGLLAELGMAVSVFGSARTKRDTPEYRLADEIASGLVKAGYAVITGGGPGIMEAANKGAAEAGGVSVGLGIELPMESGLNDYVNVGRGVPLLLRPQDRLRQVLAGLRGAARRLRHDGRAVRGAHAASPPGRSPSSRSCWSAAPTGTACSAGSRRRCWPRATSAPRSSSCSRSPTTRPRSSRSSRPRTPACRSK